MNQTYADEIDDNNLLIFFITFTKHILYSNYYYIIGVMIAG